MYSHKYIIVWTTIPFQWLTQSTISVATTTTAGTGAAVFVIMLRITKTHALKVLKGNCV